MATDERNRTLDLRPTPFPEDFGERLEGLKTMTGLSWGEFAELLGATERGQLKWRRGGPPSGAYFWAIMAVARRVPGGFDLMLGGDAGAEDDDHPNPPWPEDFAERLARLEDLSGISLEQFARAFGLPEDRAREWRSGGMPTTDEVWAMALWASQVPGGSDVLLAPWYRLPPARE